MKFEEWADVRVFRRGTEILIVGTPDEDDEGHNCDAMGCNSIEHVLCRATYVKERERDEATPTTSA